MPLRVIHSLSCHSVPSYLSLSPSLVIHFLSCIPHSAVEWKCVDCGTHVGQNSRLIRNHKKVCLPRVLAPPIPLPEPLISTPPFMDDDDEAVDDDDATMEHTAGEVVNACLARWSDDVLLSDTQECLEWHAPSISDSEAQVRGDFSLVLYKPDSRPDSVSRIR